MANLNKVLLMGNLTRDPQLSYLPSQTPVVEFGMAMNRRYRTGRTRSTMKYRRDERGMSIFPEIHYNVLTTYARIPWFIQRTASSSALALSSSIVNRAGPEPQRCT